MVRGEFLIFGYRELTVNAERITEATNVLLKLGITAEISPTGSVMLSARCCKRFTSAAADGVILSVGELRGLPGFFVRNRHRYGTAAAIFILTIMYFLLGNIIWDIRISGNSTLPDEEILSELSDAGFTVGALWSKIDRNETETRLLSDSETLSWISINRSGAVAYVEVVELAEGEDKPIPDGIGNIVADRDCVIEEITVRRGVAVVEVGDVVKKGDILISGIVENEGGAEYCHADGTVKGVCDGEVSAFLPSVSTQTAVVDEVRRIGGIKIFGFSINLLKKYGNYDDSCVIIEKEKELVLMGRSVPISTVYVYIQSTEQIEVKYDTEALVSMVSEKYSEQLVSFLKGSDLVSISTDAEFRDGGYEMTGRVIYSTDVGVYAPIEIAKDEK